MPILTLANRAAMLRDRTFELRRDVETRLHAVLELAECDDPVHVDALVSIARQLGSVAMRLDKWALAEQARREGDPRAAEVERAARAKARGNEARQERGVRSRSYEEHLRRDRLKPR